MGRMLPNLRLATQRAINKQSAISGVLPIKHKTAVKLYKNADEKKTRKNGNMAE